MDFSWLYSDTDRRLRSTKHQQGFSSSAHLSAIPWRMQDEASGTRRGGSLSRSIDPRLMQAYAELPDLADIKTCIDAINDEMISYCKQITFLVEQELNALWLRICGLQATAGELAYMYAYLALAAHCTLLNRASIAEKPDFLVNILGSKACNRHARIASYLLDLATSQDRQGNEDPHKQVLEDPLARIHKQPYNFRNLADCPALLLRCCTQVQLLSYHWHAHHYQEAYKFSLKAVASARHYGLFALVKAADRQGLGLNPVGGDLSQDEWNQPQLRFVAGLRRLHFELSALVHMCTFPLMVPVSLDAQELCKDKGNSHYLGAEDLRVPVRMYSPAAKMEKAELYSTAVSKMLTIEATDFEGLIDSNQISRSAQDLRIQAVIELDTEIRDMIIVQQLPVESFAEAPAWRSKPVNDAMEAALANFTLYKRFDRNRIRFELLSRLIGSYSYVAALQGLAMEAAMDTLLLLGKALLMLQSSWAVTGWLNWLDHQVNAAIHNFNRTIMHQVSMDARMIRDGSSAEPQAAADRSETSDDSALTRSNVSSRQTSDFSLAATISNTQVSDTSTSSSRESGTNRRMQEKKELSKLYRDKSGILFADFIFSFNSLFEVLQDLHIFPPAAFEAARILKRLKVPRSPRLIEMIKKAEESSLMIMQEEDYFL